jgi:hypothetical protein
VGDAIFKFHRFGGLTHHFSEIFTVLVDQLTVSVDSPTVLVNQPTDLVD